MKTELAQQASTDQERLSKVTYSILIWLFSLGTMFIMIMPLMVGAMIDQLGFSEADSGRVVSSAMLGVLIVSVTAILSVHKWNLRLTSYIGLFVIAASEILSAFTSTLGMMNLLRFVNGLGAGMILASINTYISGFKYSDSIFGVAFAGKFTIGAIALFTFPYLIKFTGIKGVFLCVGFMATLGLILMTWFLKKDPRTETEHINIPTWSLILNLKISLIFLLAALLALFIANNGMWAYYERFGMDAGIPLERIGLCLSLSLIGGSFGGSLAAWVGGKIERTISIALGLGAMAGSVVLIILHINFLTYLVSALGVTVGFSFAIPFFLGAIAEKDHSGRLLNFGGLLIFLGSFLGPTLASFCVDRGSYIVLMLGGIGLLILSFFLVLLSNLGIFRRERETVEA